MSSTQNPAQSHCSIQCWLGIKVLVSWSRLLESPQYKYLDKKNVYCLPVPCSEKNLWGHFKSGCRCSGLDVCAHDSRHMYHLDYNLEKKGENFLTKKRVVCQCVCVGCACVGSSKDIECIIMSLLLPAAAPAAF